MTVRVIAVNQTHLQHISYNTNMKMENTGVIRWPCYHINLGKEKEIKPKDSLPRNENSEAKQLRPKAYNMNRREQMTDHRLQTTP